MKHKRKLALLMIAKSTSNRLPGKNTLEFNKQPMYMYTLEKCFRMNLPIILDSNDTSILENAKSKYPQIRIHNRPINLQGDDIPSVPIFQQIVKDMSLQDYYILNIQANSPSIKMSTLRSCINIMLYCNVDELLTIYETRRNNGSIWGFSPSRLLNYGDPYIHKPDHFVIDDSIDIHTLEDFQQSIDQENARRKSIGK